MGAMQMRVCTATCLPLARLLKPHIVVAMGQSSICLARAFQQALGVGNFDVTAWRGQEQPSYDFHFYSTVEILAMVVPSRLSFPTCSAMPLQIIALALWIVPKLVQKPWRP